LLPDQGSNLDFLESKSSVLPVTPSGNTSEYAFLITQGLIWLAKVELFPKRKTGAEKNLRVLRHSQPLVLDHGRAFDKAVGPEPVFVQYGDHGVLQVAVIVEVDASVNGCGVALPD
jgi:hypothetical protein